MKQYKEQNALIYNTLEHFYSVLEHSFRPTAAEDLYCTIDAIL
jgi:hypothetical protein